MQGIKLSELPPQTARDVKNDTTSALFVEEMADELKMHLGPRVQSDHYIKWVTSHR
jgi:hypothetical protein